MNFLMLSVKQYLKNFPLTALIRPFSGVNSLMNNVCGVIQKGFPTSATLISLFSTVDFLVLDKLIFVTEGFPTLAAHVGLSPVWIFWYNSFVFAVESLPTFCALIRLLVTLHFLMLDKFVCG